MEEELDEDDFELVTSDGPSEPFIVEQGWLEKKSERDFLATWQRRFFVLTSDSLLAYYSEEFQELRGRIPVADMTQLKWTREPEAFIVHLVTPSRTYTLSALTEADLHRWVRALVSLRRGQLSSAKDLKALAHDQQAPLPSYSFGAADTPTSPLVTPNPAPTPSPAPTPAPHESAPPQFAPYLCPHPEERSTGSFAQNNMQRLVFCRWVNLHVGRYGAFTEPKQIVHPPQIDAADGIVIVRLAERLTGTTPPDTTLQPANQRAIMDNINRSVKHMADHFAAPFPALSVPVLASSAKAQLDLLWALIHISLVRPVTHAGLKDRPALLAWVQERTSVYRGLNVTGFGSDWRSGLALCALVHAQRPSLLDWAALHEFAALENVHKALQLLEQHFGVPRLLDESDVLLDPAPDECALVTLLAEVWVRFRSQ